MELRHLRYFVAVAEELHFGRAARKLFLSQPALSRQILELEKELGTALFLRTNREVRLTVAGVSFLRHAREILNHVERSKSEARSMGRGGLGCLEIGYISSLGAQVVPRIVRAFRSQHPEVEVRLRFLIPPNHLAQIQTAQIDVALVHESDVPKELAVEPLLEERYVVAAPEGHALDRRGPVTLRELDGAPFVFFPRHIGPETYDQMTDAFRKVGAEPNVVLETFPGYSILSAVASGIGAALFPETMMDFQQKGVVYRRIRGICPGIKWQIVYHPSDLTGAKRVFVELVRKMYPPKSARR
jgi:DNA-binding transcriptional LysR family regulator